MDKTKQLTESSLQASWISIPNKLFPNYNGKITINAKEVNLLLFVNDERKYKISFDAAADWDEDYLCFKAEPRFYVLSANEMEMVFGEFKNPGKKDHQEKWQLKFEKVV